MPVILMVVSILVLVAGGMAALSSGGVNAARNDAISERALYAAEAGLAQATKQLMKNEEPDGLSGTLGDSKWKIKVYKNDTGAPMSTDGGPLIPADTILVMSTGTTVEKVNRQSWALFKKGLGNFDVGALAEDQISAKNSELKAYNSDNEQDVPGAPVVACNNSTGWSYALDNSKVKGSAFTLGTANIDLQNGSTVSRKSVMKAKIIPAAIVVPDVANAGAGGADPDPTPEPVYASMSTNSEYKFVPPAGGEMLIEKNCLRAYVKPDGSFRAVETGNNKVIEGNLLTGSVTRNDDGNWTLEGTPPNFSLHGQWHSFGWNPSTGQWAHDLNTSNVEGAPTQWTAPPEWVKAFMGSAPPPPNVTDPTELSQGKYDTVTINTGTTQIKPNSNIVVKNLIVNAGGKLRLPSTADKTNIYVTGRLIIKGKDALVNDAQKAPLLNLYYTGTEKVEMSGGSATYATVFAPFASIELFGEGSAFFGAMVGKNVKLNDAIFTYDVATSGVGQGVDGSAIDVLARYRP